MLNRLFKLFLGLRRQIAYGLTAVLIAVGIVVYTPQPSVALPWLELILRGIQVIQLSTMSNSQEVSIGGQINEQILQEVSLYNDDAIAEYVDGIGQALVPFSVRSDIPYVFQVVNDDAVNAFATMGGYVYVTTGLMATADNEAELAGVIGHEIGHIAGRHAVEQMREAAIAQGVLTAAGLNENDAVNIGVELALRRPNSRQDELEADALGLDNMTAAGYAPIAMVTFMEKLLGQASIPSILSTHPATSDRIDELNILINPSTADVGTGLDSAAYRSKIQSLL